MNNTLAKYLFFIMEFFRGEYVYRYLKELEVNQRLSREEIKRIQRRKLDNLLNFVIANNRYYINKYKGCNVLNGLSWLPPLTKEELRENYQNILSDGSRKHLDLVETSGSTGVPLQFYRDRLVFGYSLASLYRARRWWGLDIGYKEAMLWGVPISTKARIKAKIRDLSLNRFREREYNINPDILLEFYKKIKKKRPDYIFGYSSMVFEFALYIKEIDLDGNALGVKAAICTSEKIPTYQRETIEDVLGCKVISEYGAAETGIISYECKKGCHHLSDDCVYVEIVDENNVPLPDGNAGRVLVTVLNSFSSPIIRYDIGDIASKLTKTCDCGVNLSILENVIGRTSDIALSPDSRVYHSIIFYYIMKDLCEKLGGIKQFKVRQTDINRLEFHIVRTEDFSNKAKYYIKSQIREKFGDSMNLEFFYHDSIEREKSGKLRDFETCLDTETLLTKMYAYSKKED